LAPNQTTLWSTLYMGCFVRLRDNIWNIPSELCVVREMINAKLVSIISIVRLRDNIWYIPSELSVQWHERNSAWAFFVPVKSPLLACCMVDANNMIIGGNLIWRQFLENFIITNLKPDTPLLTISYRYSNGSERHKSLLKIYRVSFLKISGWKVEPSVPLIVLHSSVFQNFNFFFLFQAVIWPTSLTSLVPVQVLSSPGAVPFFWKSKKYILRATATKAHPQTRSQ
jgi:hypothetical protein